MRAKAVVPLLLLLLTVRGARAQRVVVGFKGGLLLTDSVVGDVNVRSEARPYTIGLMLELRLASRFAFEADLLYKRVGYRAFQSDSGLAIAGQARAHSWELPLLLKYYPPWTDRLRPFVIGGYVVRHLTGAKGNAHLTGVSSSGIPIDATLSIPGSIVVRNDPTHGIAAGAGLRLRAWRLHVAPEVRYTRWAGRPFDDQGPRGFSLKSSQNQMELLLGLGF